MKILHLITGLDVGGAEMMLVRLCKQQIMDGDELLVVSLKSGGKLNPQLLEEKIAVCELGFPKGKFSFSGFNLLIKLIRNFKPEVIHCWMYHANFVGSIASLFAGNVPVVWAIHNTTLSIQNSSQITILLMRLLGFLSFLPKQIVYCSQLSKSLHEKYHYSEKKGIFIPNGVDTTVFSPDSEIGAEFLSKIKIQKTSFVIGMIGRYDPQKDYQNFLAAADLIHQFNNSIQFVMCGPGVDDENEVLLNRIKQLNQPDHFHLIGTQMETQKVHNAFDIFVLSSMSEAFPVVLAEAMACGVPCVSTDVGDAAYIIEDTGKIVPPKHPQAIANAVEQLLSMPDEAFETLKAAARNRIVEHFSLQKIAQLYKKTYEFILKKE